MTRFKPLRPPMTRLITPMDDSDLPEHHRLHTLLNSQERPKQESAALVSRMLDLTAPPKARMLEGFLRTLSPVQRAAVFCRNQHEAELAFHASREAGFPATANHRQWTLNPGALIITISRHRQAQDLSQALYAIFLGRPPNRERLRQLEAMTGYNGHQEPPHIVHLVTTGSIDEILADILLRVDGTQLHPGDHP